MIAFLRKAWMRVSSGGIWTLKDPRYWSDHLGGGRTTTSSEFVGEESALNYSAVWCATQLFCGIGGSLPLPVYRGLDDERRVKRRMHPVHQLLNVSPNPEQTAFAFRSILWQWQVNWGNAYAEIERQRDTDGAEIVALWPIHPSRVRIRRDEQQTLYYEVQDEVGGGTTEVDAWRIWHIPSILTIDGITGRGVVTHARETIGAGIAAEKKAANSFGTGNIPRVVIEQEGRGLDDSQRKAFRQEWQELYGSPDGYPVALLGGGAKAKALSFSNVDSQFLETRGFDVEEIGRWYGLPPHMLKRLVGATYNNMETLGAEFIRYTLNSWLKQWEQSIALSLFSERERKRYFAEHNVEYFLRGDSAARAALYHSGINDGWLSRNEARKKENLDPVPGGDTFLVQGAMVPLDETGKPPEAAEPMPNKPAAPQAPADDAEDISDNGAALAKRLLKRDLSRMLTKETRAVLQMAKTDGNFVRKLDEFYEKHVQTVQDATLETCEVLMNGQTPVFVSKWCESGKSAVLESAGRAVTKDELTDAVARLVESKLWTDRPERSIGEMAA